MRVFASTLWDSTHRATYLYWTCLGHNTVSDIYIIFLVDKRLVHFFFWNITKTLKYLLLYWNLTFFFGAIFHNVFFYLKRKHLFHFLSILPNPLTLYFVNSKHHYCPWFLLIFIFGQWLSGTVFLLLCCYCRWAARPCIRDQLLIMGESKA